MRYILMGWLVGALAFIAGCGGFSSDFAERELVDRAPELIGPADRYRAEVQGLSRNRVEYVRLVGIGVRPDPDLVVDPLVLTLRNAQFTTNPFEVTSIGEATFSGRISEASINRYLQKQGRTTGNFRNVRVELLQDQVRVSALAAVLQVEVPITTTGRIRIGDGLRVNYDPTNLTVGGVGVPASVLGMLATRVNPLVDLSGLRFTPLIERVTIDPGGLLVEGTAHLRFVNGRPVQAR